MAGASADIANEQISTKEVAHSAHNRHHEIDNSLECRV